MSPSSAAPRTSGAPTVRSVAGTAKSASSSTSARSEPAAAAARLRAGQKPSAIAGTARAGIPSSNVSRTQGSEPTYGQPVELEPASPRSIPSPSAPQWAGAR